ncbi:unnamed protein product [Closterium sp. Naga37s-1]|nr:unnamed protein product [Closterium sp. Naga37s-1]
MRAPSVRCVGSARGEVCNAAVAFARLAFLTSPSALVQIPSGSGLPSSGSTDSSSDSSSYPPIYSDPSSCTCSFIGSSPTSSGLPVCGGVAQQGALLFPARLRPRQLAPVLLRAAAALVAREGAGAPSRPREPVYRSPHRRTHPHLRARGGSFRRRRPPRPPLGLQRQIFGPHPSAPPPLVLQQSPPPPPLSLSQQSSQQQSSGPTASSPVVASPALTSAPQLSSGVAAPPPPLSPLSPAPPAVSAPLPAPPPPSSPPLAPPPLSSSAGAPLVSHPSSPLHSASPPPVEPPQWQHPLVLSGPVPEARFPPPRARSPELPPDAPDPEDDERWWNGELWESPPQPATLWGREWDIQSDVVKDILRWEKRMVAVGECMSHVATVLEQLHAGLVARNLVLRDPQLTEPQQGVVREAAAQGLWRLLRLPLEPEFPEQDEGPGARAFLRVAKAAEESPLELVPALAVLLRWMRRRFYVLNRV